MFRRKFLNFVITLMLIILIILCLIIELIELPFALIFAFITNEWPTKFTWFVAGKLISILPPENVKMYAWPLKIN